MSKSFGAASTTDEVLDGVKLSGKRVLVTGVSAGLGVETARALAAHGAEVVGAARDLTKAKASAQARTLASEARSSSTSSKLPPFAGSRLVNLSSAGHQLSDVDLDDPNFERTPYNAWASYGRSKTANILFAVEFDRRHKDRGIRAAALHPGAIQTELSRYLDEEARRELTEIMTQVGKLPGAKPIVYKSVPQGAATSVWAAAVAKADAVGGRYCEDCHVAEVIDAPGFTFLGVRPYALNSERAEALWAKSEQMVGERFV